MILERTKDEILVRLPANMDITELQNMLDYLDYKEKHTYRRIKRWAIE